MQHRNDRGLGGWPAWWTLCLLLAAYFALPAPLRAEPYLGVTLLPAARGEDGTRLAVSSPGADSARLSAVLRHHGLADKSLLREEALAGGVNLLPLPLAADATGVLALTVVDATGHVLAEWKRDIAKSRGDAWLPIGSGVNGAEFNQAPQVAALGDNTVPIELSAAGPEGEGTR